MRILIVRNNSNSKATDASLLLATYLAGQGMDYLLVDSSDLSSALNHDLLNEALRNGIDLAVVLGGDGTILRTARQVGNAGIPILGINFGRLGFLANSGEEGVVRMVAAALAGDAQVEQRTNLRIDVICEGEPDPFSEEALRGDSEWEDEGVFDLPGETEKATGLQNERAHNKAEYGARTFFALNELAVTRGGNGRIIDFSLDISGAHIAEMRGDGLVVATATGSTAYALSAGGPLVAPGFNGLVVVPLAPHTLHSRALVTASNDVVEVDISRNAEDREATLFADGELLSFERPVKHIYVRRGSTPTHLVRYRHEGFYEHASKVFF